MIVTSIWFTGHLKLHNTMMTLSASLIKVCYLSDIPIEVNSANRVSNVAGNNTMYPWPTVQHAQVMYPWPTVQNAQVMYPWPTKHIVTCIGYTSPFWNLQTKPNKPNNKKKHWPIKTKWPMHIILTILRIVLFYLYSLFCLNLYFHKMKL